MPSARPATVQEQLPPEDRISVAEFVLLRDLIQERSGVVLGRMKRALIVSRLARRLKDLGLPDFGAYYEHVVGDGGDDELQRILDCIVTNETRFFREPRQFAFLEQEVFPTWRRQAREGYRSRRVRAWSAACSTGEEAYSLAMTLLWNLPEREGWQLGVFGSDLSTRVLRSAVTATWRKDQVERVPRRLLTRFMLRGVRQQEGMAAAGPDLRSTVRFRQLNLVADEYTNVGRFDLIFCRNVLMYFDAQSRAAVLRHLSQHLLPNGYLLLGHAERPGSALDHLSRVEATIYQNSVAEQN